MPKNVCGSVTVVLLLFNNCFYSALPKKKKIALAIHPSPGGENLFPRTKETMQSPERERAKLRVSVRNTVGDLTLFYQDKLIIKL